VSDHRRLQRTLFRMQLDASFAQRVRARELDALASTGLGLEELELLLAAPAAGIEADPGGKRRVQFLRNVSSEHAISVAWAVEGGRDAQLLESFTASRHFHDAVRNDTRLPLAFADHALERAQASGQALRLGFAQLERAMASLRRQDVERGAAPHGGFVLAPHAEVVDLPAGTVDAAATIQQALAEGVPVPRGLAANADVRERALLAVSSSESPHRLRDVSVEALGDLPGVVLAACREPVAMALLERLAEAEEATPEELRGFLDALVGEGVLLRAAG
jgi:hypothetical protein